LEKEVADAALRYTAVIQATSDAAQRAMRIVGMCGSSPTEQEISNLCEMWMDQENKETGDGGAIEWGEQRARFKDITRTMENKFAQLVKLKRVLTTAHAGKHAKPGLKPKGPKPAWDR
jgi:chemotaxis regulatin CheY-phosphate phosphatase CheZ